MRFRPKISILLQLVSSFFRVGMFTFGGGYAMLPILEREVCDRRSWVNREEIMDIYAVSQMIPGVIASNSATFIGYKLAGVLGAVFALIGIVLPSLIVITVIAVFFNGFRENIYVKKAFMGIRSAVAALLILATVRMGKAGIKDGFGVFIALCAFLSVIIFSANPTLVIICGGLAGYLWPRYKPAGSNNDKDTGEK